MSIFQLLYQPYKWFIFLPLAVANTAVLAVVCVLVCLVVSPRTGSRYVARPWAKMIFVLTPAGVDIRGCEHLDKGQSYIVVANHVSQMDIPALYGWLDLDLKWVMKKELRKMPFIGFASAAMGHIFIDRSNGLAAMQTLCSVKDRLVGGTSVLLFPEGTRSRDGQMRKFKRGAFMMAKELDLPILPVTLLGTGDILPAGGLNFTPGRARMIIHEPIPQTWVREHDEQQLLQLAQQTIAAGLHSAEAQKLGQAVQS